MTTGIKDIITAVKEAPRAGEGSLTIVGGVLQLPDPSQLAEVFGTFMEKWNQAVWPGSDNRPFRVFEYVDAIEFTNESRNSTRDGMFSRGRQFDQRGDLSIRKDDNRLMWNFIGPANASVPIDGGQSFWSANRGVELIEEDCQALLWGEFWKGKGVRDDRVGWADLNYPTSHLPSPVERERYQLAYTSYALDGVESFVWWKGIERAQH